MPEILVSLKRLFAASLYISLAAVIVIMQWVILAVRNLCENNTENQKIIASLTQRGVVDSTLLKEMGLSLHNDGNNGITAISLETLNSLRNHKS